MLTIEILRAILLGFTIGLTGALVPGPMFFATIELSLKKGWFAGPKVVLGHMLVEFFLSVLILLGFASFVGSSTISAISVIGGLALAVFGLLTVKDAKAAASAGISPEKSDMKLTSNPVVLGLITSVSNPYFWIWWLTAGSALVLRAYELGLFVSIAIFSDTGQRTLAGLLQYPGLSAVEKLCSPSVLMKLSCTPAEGFW